MSDDLHVPRNGDFFGELQLLDVAGNPIDLTGHGLEASARAVAGDSVVIASATISFVEPADGRFSMRWNGDDFSDIGEATQVARVAYDVKHTYPDGVRVVALRGNLLLIPKATD